MQVRSCSWNVASCCPASVNCLCRKTNPRPNCGREPCRCCSCPCSRVPLPCSCLPFACRVLNSCFRGVVLLGFDVLFFTFFFAGTTSLETPPGITVHGGGDVRSVLTCAFEENWDSVLKRKKRFYGCFKNIDTNWFYPPCGNASSFSCRLFCRATELFTLKHIT